MEPNELTKETPLQLGAMSAIRDLARDRGCVAVIVATDEGELTGVHISDAAGAIIVTTRAAALSWMGRRATND